MSDYWIDTVLPSTSRESVRKHRTSSSGAATSYDSSNMCRDFSLDRDPSIEVYRSNAAESTLDVPTVSVNVAEAMEPLDLTSKNPAPFPVYENSSVITSSTCITTSYMSNKYFIFKIIENTLNIDQ